MDREPRVVSRRRILQTAAGTAGVAAASESATAQGGTRRTVEMTDELVFAPDSITVAPGDTVVWENVGSIGHSVTAYEENIPAEAEYFASGGFESEDAARSAYSAGDSDSGDLGADATFEHTFPITGTYEYFCIPHESVEMLGAVEVVEGGPSEGGGDDLSVVPESAKSIAVAATAALCSVLGLAYMFMKYGGDYGVDETDKAD